MSLISTQGSLLHPRKKSRDSDCFDFLSNLHENLLSQILSRLPTKVAVQTSVLSKDWMYKWTCIYHVDIITHSGDGDKDNFVAFVDRMLLYACNIKSFRFVCYQYGDVNRVVTWIRNLLSRENIESVEISYYGPPIDLHWCPHERSSLKILKLDQFRGIFSIATQSSFLNLRSFCLCKIQIHSGNSNSGTLVLNFPFLERFEVHECEWVNVKFVKINAPMLNTYMSSSCFDKPSDYSIEIIGAKILTYKCCGGLPENVILTGSQVVSCIEMFNEGGPDRVELFVSKHIGLQVWKLLDDSPSLIELKLSEFVLMALQSAPPIRLHDKLRRLCLFHHPINIKQLFDLLHAAPLSF